MPGFLDLGPQLGLSYEDEGHGAPVLLIHGVGSDKESWDGVLWHLKPGLRYVRFDLRGHGRSHLTPGPYALSDFVADTIAILDHLKIGEASIVGFSLGGLIAQAVALAHPERVRTLCLVSTVAGRTPGEQARVEARSKTLSHGGAAAHLENAVDRWFTDDFAARHPGVLQARKEKSLQNDPACYAAAYRVLASSDLGGELQKVAAPTLVMTGENDIGSSARMAKFIHSKIAGSQLHILPRLKHSVLLEAPAQIAVLIERFLDAHLTPDKKTDGGSTLLTSDQNLFDQEKETPTIN